MNENKLKHLFQISDNTKLKHPFIEPIGDNPVLMLNRNKYRKPNKREDDMEERKTLTLKNPVQLPLGKPLQKKPNQAIPVKTKEELQAEKRQAQMKKEREEKKAAFELKKQKKQQLFDKLFQDYPNCFSRESPKPLKQDIHLDLVKDLTSSLSKRQLQPLRGCLHTYTNSKKYHQAMVTESHRIDLIGNPVEEITQEHREHAKQKLAIIGEKEKQRNK